MRLGTAFWLIAPNSCCRRRRDILSFNKHKLKALVQISKNEGGMGHKRETEWLPEAL